MNTFPSSWLSKDKKHLNFKCMLQDKTTDYYIISHRTSADENLQMHEFDISYF